MSDSVRVEIFDPPMCCPGGLCGPVIDPALLDIQEAILKLKEDAGVVVQRYLLQQDGARFMQNPEVLTLLKQYSTGILPITAVNGKVVKTKGYPSREDLVRYVREQALTNSESR